MKIDNLSVYAEKTVLCTIPSQQGFQSEYYANIYNNRNNIGRRILATWECPQRTALSELRQLFLSNIGYTKPLCSL